MTATRGNKLSGHKTIVSKDHEVFFAKPNGWNMICAKKKGNQKLYAWRPIPPSPDFTSLGDILTTTPAEPKLPQYRCVHKVLLHKKDLREAVDQIWNDKGGFFSGGEDFGVWEAPEPCGTIIIAHSETALPDFPTHTIHSSVLPITIRPLAIAVKDFDPERNTDQLQLRTYNPVDKNSIADVLTLLECDPKDALWKGYKNKQPGKVGWIPMNCVMMVQPRICRALSDRDAAKKDEISFKAGDVIVAISPVSSWWTGFAANDPTHIGHFPQNYVETA